MATLKNYSVSININKRFEGRNMQRVGSVETTSKEDAVKQVYEAFNGVDNDACIYTEFIDLITPSNKSRLVAEIEK
jgi:chaperonin cofactor prefoldin